VPPRKNDGSARRPQRAEAVHFALRVLVATHTEGTEVMSRGLGKIERTILDDITIGGPSSVLIHSWGLLCHHNCFRRPANWNFEPTTAERKAVTRAMRSFVRKFPQYALTGGKERKMLDQRHVGEALSRAPEVRLAVGSDGRLARLTWPRGAARPGWPRRSGLVAKEKARR
jgi:hypothetical protein